MSVQFQAECLASIELEEHFLKRGRDVAGWVAASANGASDVTQVLGGQISKGLMWPHRASVHGGRLDERGCPEPGVWQGHGAAQVCHPLRPNRCKRRVLRPCRNSGRMQFPCCVKQQRDVQPRPGCLWWWKVRLLRGSWVPPSGALTLLSRLRVGSGKYLHVGGQSPFV